MKTSEMSNEIARKHYLHDNDDHHCNLTGKVTRTCYFSERGYDGGWGFWVRATGEVDVDETSANGKLPSKKIIDACICAAKKYLAK